MSVLGAPLCGAVELSLSDDLPDSTGATQQSNRPMCVVCAQVNDIGAVFCQAQVCDAGVGAFVQRTRVGCNDVMVASFAVRGHMAGLAVDDAFGLRRGVALGDG